MPLFFYNTLTRQKQEFASLSGGPKIGLYVCGPTVYSYAHIGNFRAYLAWDVLRRVLERNKFKPLHVMNITDVGHLQNDSDTAEDKMEKAAREEKKSPFEIAEFYTKIFLSDSKKLHILPPTILCKATDHIPEMIKLIQKLEKKGLTYSTPHGIYFDVQKFPGYGKISGQNLEQLKAVRESVERDPFKHHPADFRLWQLAQPTHAMQWDSPWGKGYPGWHIECSAMSMKYLGESFDIHCGGMDHIPIHHPNEIAQSEGATGKPFVRFWLHNSFIKVDANKMAKSLRNIYTISDLEKEGFSALDYRFLVLTAHYRSELNFTFDSLRAAQRTRNSWNDFIRRVQKLDEKEAQPNGEIKEFLKLILAKIDEAFNDDLNTPTALAVLSEFQRRVNGWMDAHQLSKSDSRQVLDLLKNANQILDVFDFEMKEYTIPAHVLRLASEREQARKSKDWKKSDELRFTIEKEGYMITDSKDGFEIKPRQ